MKAKLVWDHTVLLAAIAITAIVDGRSHISFAGAIAIASNSFRNKAVPPIASHSRKHGAASPLFAATTKRTALPDDQPAAAVEIILYGEGRRYARWGRGVRRPDNDEVVRVSWGIKKHSSSYSAARGLDAEERILFDLARRRGLVSVVPRLVWWG